MTIDSGWIRILKQNCPNAFADKIPVASKPHVVFIDGQIKLMKSEKIRTWEQFVRIQFTNTVERAFSTGARVVVLGFDNYLHVPVSKAPTQRKRSSKIETMDFGPDSELPSIIPESWPMAIRNRAFKSKVVRMVCTNLANQYKDIDGGRTLVIDWMDKPCVIGAPLILGRVRARPCGSGVLRGPGIRSARKGGRSSPHSSIRICCQYQQLDVVALQQARRPQRKLDVG